MTASWRSTRAVARKRALGWFCRRHLGYVPEEQIEAVQVRSPDRTVESIELCGDCCARPDHERWLLGFEQNRAKLKAVASHSPARSQRAASR